MTAGGPSREARVIEAALNRAAGGRPIPGNRVRLLSDGPETYDVMLDLIARAERRIHLENYIIRDDDLGRRFAQAPPRGQDGVRVRVMYTGWAPPPVERTGALACGCRDPRLPSSPGFLQPDSQPPKAARYG